MQKRTLSLTWYKTNFETLKNARAKREKNSDKNLCTKEISNVYHRCEGTYRCSNHITKGHPVLYCCTPYIMDSPYSINTRPRIVKVVEQIHVFGLPLQLVWSAQLGRVLSQHRRYPLASGTIPSGFYPLMGIGLIAWFLMRVEAEGIFVNAGRMWASALRPDPP